MCWRSCAAEWLQAQEEKVEDNQEFRHLVCEVMSHVRFFMMSAKHLAALLLHPFTSRFKEIITEGMRLAMNFQSQRSLPQNCPPSALIPRLYTAEVWSVHWTLENFPLLPAYGVSTLMFSTPASLVDMEAGPTYDWVLELYPKGVCFKRFYLLIVQGTLEMPEHVYKTVRLSLTLKDIADKIVRVNVGILIFSSQDGHEYIHKVIKKPFVFSNDSRMLNIDDLIPYDELNHRTFTSPYLIGPAGDSLKIQIIITPSSITS
ncbi:Tango10 [Cordylochernes scorpioides]|uniref:Tango10 n=1 Tax=Cordylochernes scorpioides TaxID=51811 RepID=A0ABY6LGS2_9ARAC|nr:Tango10 [Cordylochernes scorpioides]